MGKNVKQPPADCSPRGAHAFPKWLTPLVPRGDFLLRVISPLIIFHVSSSIREKAPEQGESETSPAAPCGPYFLHI